MKLYPSDDILIRYNLVPVKVFSNVFIFTVYDGHIAIVPELNNDEIKLLLFKIPDIAYLPTVIYII